MFKKWVKRVLIYSGILLLSSFLALVSIFYFFSDDIKKYALSKLNENLTTKVVIQKIDMVFWETFPNISLKLDDISIEESAKLNGKPIIVAKKLLLVFNIWDIINKNYKIKQIRLSDASVRFKSNINGLINFDFIKTTKTGSKSSQKEDIFDIKKISFLNVNFLYEDLSSGSIYNFYIKKLSSNGEFGNTSFTMFGKGAGKANNLVVNNQKLLMGQNFTINTTLNINTQKGSYNFDNTSFKIEKGKFIVNGNILDAPKKPIFIDLKINGDNLTLVEFASMMPGNFSKQLSTYESDGKLKFDAIIKGYSGKNEEPHITTNFGITNGTLKAPGINQVLKNVSFTGKFDNKSQNGSPFLIIKSVKAELNNKVILGDLKLSDISNPFLDLSLKGAANLENITEFLELEDVKLKGEVNFDFSIHSNIKAFEKIASIQDIQSNGFITFGQVDVIEKVSNFKYSNLNGKLIFNNDKLNVSNLTGELSDNKFTFVGSFDHIFSLFFDKNELFTANGSLHFANLDANKMFSSGNSVKSSAKFRFPDKNKYAFDLNLSADRIIYRKIVSINFRSALSLKNDMLNFQNISTNAFGGSLTINGSLSQKPVGFISRLNLECKSININSLFVQMENFGQKAITQANLSGNVNASVQLAAELDDYLMLISKSLYSYVDFELVNGELINYEPLLSLSKFVQIDELKRVKFATISNQFEIKDRTVTIPNMKLVNSALNIELAGTCNFDYYLDYKFKIKVGDLLASKYGLRKRRNADEIEDNGSQGLSIYLSMTGTPDNLAIKYDKISSKNKFVEKTKSEKNELKEAIKKEFGGKNKKAQLVPETEVVEWDEEDQE